MKVYQIEPAVEAQFRRLKEREVMLLEILEQPDMKQYRPGCLIALAAIQGELQEVEAERQLARRESEYWINESEGSLRNAFINGRPMLRAVPPVEQSHAPARFDGLEALRKVRQAKSQF